MRQSCYLTGVNDKVAVDVKKVIALFLALLVSYVHFYLCSDINSTFVKAGKIAITVFS